MTNPQLESQVHDWLIDHYVNNDVRLSQQVKAEMLNEYPKLSTEVHPDRLKIEALCRREEFVKLEQKYFSPPSGPPSMEEALFERPLRYLYQDIIRLMSEELMEKSIALEDNKAAQEIWGNSLVTALLVNPADDFLFYPDEGMRRLDILYHRVKLNYNWPDVKGSSQLDQQFQVRFADAELEYLRDVHDSAVPRVPDARQKAEAYFNSKLTPKRE